MVINNFNDILFSSMDMLRFYHAITIKMNIYSPLSSHIVSKVIVCLNED